MMALDEDALVCDLAETYHIFDMYQFPCIKIATLAKGLREDSRIKMKLNGLEVKLDTLLLAHIADSTAINVWAKTKDAEKGQNRPNSLVKVLTEKIDPSKQVKGFTSGHDFDDKWRQLNGN